MIMLFQPFGLEVEQHHAHLPVGFSQPFCNDIGLGSQQGPQRVRLVTYACRIIRMVKRQVEDAPATSPRLDGIHLDRGFPVLVFTAVGDVEFHRVPSVGLEGEASFHERAQVTIECGEFNRPGDGATDRMNFPIDFGER